MFGSGKPGVGHEGRRYGRAMTDLHWPDAQPTLDAEGLTVRPWRESDADAVYAACQDPEIARWTTVPSPFERSHAEAFVGPLSVGAWAHKTAVKFAAVGADGTVVGSFGLVRVDTVIGVTEVGYWVAPAARRRSPGRSATRARATPPPPPGTTA